MKTLNAYLAQVRDDFSGAADRAGIDPLLTAARVLLYVVLVGVVVAIVFTMIGLVSYLIAVNTALFVPIWLPVWEPVARLACGFAALAMVQVIIHHLLAMIRAVAHGDAFATDNVARIEKIAGDVLGLQILGTLAAIVGVPVGGDVNGYDFAVGLSPAGIAFVLLLYILARVFRQGAVMREDLEGTV